MTRKYALNVCVLIAKTMWDLILPLHKAFIANMPMLRPCHSHSSITPTNVLMRAFNILQAPTIHMDIITHSWTYVFQSRTHMHMLLNCIFDCTLSLF